MEPQAFCSFQCSRADCHNPNAARNLGGFQVWLAQLRESKIRGSVAGESRRFNVISSTRTAAPSAHPNLPCDFSAQKPPNWPNVRLIVSVNDPALAVNKRQMAQTFPVGKVPQAVQGYLVCFYAGCCLEALAFSFWRPKLFR